MKNTFLCLFLTCVLIGCVVQLAVAQAGCSNCVEGELCCNDIHVGSVCYNTTGYSCLQTTGGFLLCGYINGNFYPAQACGGTCYDSEFYTCCNNALYSTDNVQGNPCLTPPTNPGPCGSSCSKPSQCCDDAHHGPLCYNPNSYVCASGTLLCSIQEGIPNLACGDACYSIGAYTCCNNRLYIKNDVSNPCRPPSTFTIAPDWDARVSFQSEGVQYPPYDVNSECSWNVVNTSPSPTYELYNCTSFTGSGSFNFNETEYVLSFTLPANAISYSSYELDVYVDNSLGQTQLLAVATSAERLSSSFNVSSHSTDEYPCNVNRVYTPLLYNVNITVEAGFVGYKSIEISPLVAWALASTTPNTLQLSLSTLSSCTCLESSGVCIVIIDCTCNSPDYHLKVSGTASSNPPYLFL